MCVKSRYTYESNFNVNIDTNNVDVDKANAGPVADDMASSGFVEGVAMAEKEFRKRLGENQVVEIEPKKGDWPDTNLHQVVQMTPAEGGGVAPGTIAEILQTGWKLEERILRPASVVVAQQEVRKTEVEADTQGTGDKKEDLGAKVSATE